MIVDGHVHFWSPARKFDIRPITNIPFFKERDFLPVHLWGDLQSCRVDKAIVVQAAPQIEETRYLLDLCEDVSFVGGVVGWVDLASPSVGGDLDELSARESLVGIRAQLTRMTDEHFIRRAEVVRGLTAVAERGLTLVLLAEQHQHDDCLETLGRVAELRVVLNHAGLPDIADRGMDDWVRKMARYALETDAVTQLSGLVDAVGAGWTNEAMRPIAFKLFDIFGPDRIMFASDWPGPLPQGADYARWWDVANGFLHDLQLSADERAMVLGGVAVQAFGISDR